MIMPRNQIIKMLSEKYYIFLQSIPFEDELYMKGIGEGKRKFLANLHIYLTTKDLPKGKKEKRYATDFVTPAALDILKKGSTIGLVYEHLVPKSKYIQDVCEDKAKAGELTVDFVYQLLDLYLWTATVTEYEDTKLSTRTMPDDWDETNIKLRYDISGLDLIEHNKVYLYE
ncbi:hypothetical protein [Bacillus toyonensis]|uniref:hypothetical protein n=1 Tax=Bacillus toyonensis TaxID=155322 RepID=UPI002E24505A|nr:hypothetical protein [Bacillus toyonensis]